MNEPLSKIAWWHAKSLGVISAGVASIVAIVGLATRNIAWAQEQIGWILLIGIHWVPIIHCVRCLIEHQCPTYYGSPTVRGVFRDGCLLLVEYSSWLGVGISVSIYVAENELERLVCAGEVINVQSNKLVQIKISSSTTGMRYSKDIWSALENQRENLIIRPGLYPRSFEDGGLQ